LAEEKITLIFTAATTSCFMQTAKFNLSAAWSRVKVPTRLHASTMDSWREDHELIAAYVNANLREQRAS